MTLVSLEIQARYSQPTPDSRWAFRTAQGEEGSAHPASPHPARQEKRGEGRVLGQRLAAHLRDRLVSSHGSGNTRDNRKTPGNGIDPVAIDLGDEDAEDEQCCYSPEEGDLRRFTRLPSAVESVAARRGGESGSPVRIESVERAQRLEVHDSQIRHCRLLDALQRAGAALDQRGYLLLRETTLLPSLPQVLPQLPSRRRRSVLRHACLPPGSSNRVSTPPLDSPRSAMPDFPSNCA